MRIGIYIRGIEKKKHPSPYTLARELSMLRVTFASILIIWQEPSKNKLINSEQLSEYAGALSHFGIEPWVWGYPWCGQEGAFVDRLQWAFEEVPEIRGVIIDPELGFQGHKVGTQRAKVGAKHLVLRLLDIMTESHDIGTTSFGAAHVHKTFPWEEFNVGFGSPQFYKTPYKSVKRGLDRWHKAGFQTVLPSVPAFGPNSGKNLEQYVNMIRSEALSQGLDMPGFILWSYRQMGEHESRFIEGLQKTA